MSTELFIQNARLRREAAERAGLAAAGGAVAGEEPAARALPDAADAPAAKSAPADDAALADIRISDGRIERVAAAGKGGAGADVPAGARVIDAEGGLVTESFVNGHLHLDKVYTLSRVGGAALAAYHGAGMGGAMTAIEHAARVKKQYDEAWIAENVRQAVELAVRYGNSHIRAFADVDTTGKLEGVKALLRVREECRDRCELQVVAFPQDGVLRDPGAEEYVREALSMGADCVGGIPWIEYTDDDAREHVERMFSLAEEYDRDVSMLVDDAGDPGLRTTEMLAVRTIRGGRQGRVTAQHARAMALYPEPYFRKLAALLVRAGISVVSDPHTGPLHARVPELRAAGVPVALGQDDIADAYYPFGRNNMLEVGFLASHLLWMTGMEQLEEIYDMITVEAARALGVERFELAEGGRADLVVLGARSVWEALWEHEPPRYVIKAGRVLQSG